MANNDNSSKLDEAQEKPKTQKEEYFTSMKNYTLDTLISGVKLLVWVIISLIIIYSCKLAQSNVLPTDANCFPYTEEVHTPDPIETNIFTNLPFSDTRKSMKLSFNVEGSESVNSFMKYFRDKKEDVKTSWFTNYIVSVFESVFIQNYSYYNFMLSFLNVIPEFLLVIFGPYLGLFILLIGVFLNGFFFFWYWISNLSWFFKKNNSVSTNLDGSIDYGDEPDWVGLSWKKYIDGKTQKEQSDWVRCVMGSILVLIPIGIILFLSISSAIFGVAFFINLFCIITFFTYSIKLEKKDASFTDLFKYFFRYNKLIIMSMFAYYVVLNAYTQLGATSAFFAALTIFLIYYLKIIEMFVPVGGEDARTSPLVSDKQAKKVPCEKKDKSKKVAKGTGPVTPVTSEPKKTMFGNLFGSKKVEAPGETTTEPKKSFFGSFLGSKKVEAPGETTTEPKKSFFGSFLGSKKVAPATGTTSVAPGETSVAPGETPNPLASPVSASPASPPITQSGGIKVNKKIKQVGDNLINELKKFNNKYAQFLL